MAVATRDIRLSSQAALAAWSSALLGELLTRPALSARRRALAVDDGDGSLAAALAQATRAEVVGCDVEPAAAARAPQQMVRRDRQSLPFADGAFDLVVCRGVLMWADDPVALLAEMRRVAAPGGAAAALAEPDWSGFEEEPRLGLGELIAVALAARGADPLAGRRVAAWFDRAGLAAEIGVARLSFGDGDEALAAAWEHHRRLLDGFVNERKLRVRERQDRRAAAAGARRMRLPATWAVAILPGG